jgi:3-methyl-2-oxobutanoate hydroxymethyltransferase
MGGYKVQGRDQHSAERILADAKALENWGVQTIVIECIPAKLGKQISQSLCSRPFLIQIVAAILGARRRGCCGVVGF